MDTHRSVVLATTNESAAQASLPNLVIPTSQTPCLARSASPGVFWSGGLNRRWIQLLDVGRGSLHFHARLREPLIELYDRAVGVFKQRCQYLAARRFTVGRGVGLRWWQQDFDSPSLELLNPFSQVIDPE
jgi:hypothetical protein